MKTTKDQDTLIEQSPIIEQLCVPHLLNFLAMPLATSQFHQTKLCVRLSPYVTGFAKRGLIYAYNFATLMSHNFVCD